MFIINSLHSHYLVRLNYFLQNSLQVKMHLEMLYSVKRELVLLPPTLIHPTYHLEAHWTPLWATLCQTSGDNSSLHAAAPLIYCQDCRANKSQVA